ncbi:MAG: B12-binding domain-containing radical SAM protein [Candidatus Lokiarchaeota archaeon]|nr:B12-binding domain-containing radical SAM protein [Candidatus Lokiarchaeota archaeon]
MPARELDLLLVNPATELAGRGAWNREPPVGLLYIAAVLDRDGFSCQTLDLSADDRPVEEILAGIPVPRVVGFTCLTNTSRAALRLASKVRTWYRASDPPAPVVVMGGPHATFAYRDILATGLIDFCLTGEVEGFVSRFIDIATTEYDLAAIKERVVTEGRGTFNVAFLDKLGSVSCSAGNESFPKELDALPLPARYLHPINASKGAYRSATVIVNRGCPNQCIFCSRQALFRACRWRSPANVLAEIQAIHEAGHYEYYNLYDNVTVSREFMKGLLRFIVADRNLRLPWGAELRVDMVDEEAASLLQQANCRCVATGIESADDGILSTAGKFQSVDKVRQGLAWLKANGIPVQAYFVVGLPGETRATFEKTVAFILESPLEPGSDRLDFFAATPYPGSALHERREELGVEILDHDPDHYDCQHLVCKPSSISLPDLEAIWRDAKALEESFNSGSLKKATRPGSKDARHSLT